MKYSHNGPTKILGLALKEVIQVKFYLYEILMKIQKKEEILNFLQQKN